MARRARTIARYSWLDVDYDASRLSRYAREGLYAAKKVRSGTVSSVEELARQSSRVDGRGRVVAVSARKLRARIARAKLELARLGRCCVECGEPIPPARRADAVHCEDACKTAKSRRPAK